MRTWFKKTLKSAFSFDRLRYLRAASHLQSFSSSLTVSHPQSTLTQGVNKPASVHQCNLVCSEGSVCAGQHAATGIKAHGGDIVIPVFMSLKAMGCSRFAAQHVCTQICVTSLEMRDDLQRFITKTVGGANESTKEKNKANEDHN